MESDKKFEEKLKKFIEKYGKRDQELSDREIEYYKDKYFFDDYDEEGDEGQQEPDERWKEYYFHYDKIKNEDFTLSKDFEITLSEKNSRYIYQIVIYDETIGENLKDITQDPDMYEEPPSISTDSLYYCINDLRIKYTKKKYKNVHTKRILDFTEDLFKEKYKKMNNMIKEGIIDFSSVWYVLDRIDTIYKVEHFDEDICFKYRSFSYRSDLKDEPLVLYGSIIYPSKKTLNLCEYSYNIKKFVGTKKLDTLKIKRLQDDEKELILEHSNKILDMFENIAHMSLKGKQYVMGSHGVVCSEKNERVIVDYEGLEKYGTSPFEFFLEKNIDKENLSESDKFLIFPFCSIFNLGINKSWGVSHIKNLSPIKYKEDAFNYLVLDDKKKKIIKCLINNKNREDKYGDFIEGKGNGLVFLLYGPPGTGKTLSAESTCEYLKKPLFNINVGDLGTDPENMESIMNTVLDYVRRWNAIIMIDEVDIFLEERETNMIVRNAMVGIFLKLLEYHDGIIFLTTNRLTSLDVAVKSRINLMLSYKELTSDSRKKIWTSLFDKWSIKVNDKILRELSEFELNGREIRNYMKLVFAIHEDENKEITGESIMSTLKDCFELSEEFKDSIKSTNSLYM